MKGLSQCALFIVLALTAGPNLAFAQRLACYTIQRGDTAARVAIQITGNAHNRHEQWFQIVDPVASRLISKAHYDRIRPGWRACIVNAAVKSRPARVQSVSDRVAARLGVASGLSRKPHTTLVWLGAVVMAMWLGWCIGEEYVSRREAVIGIMTRFGNRFIHEFERPLIQSDAADRPLRSQLRCHPRRARLDILLAPAAGRRYPNLYDHRKNVEYDVTRVLQMLADQPFVNGSLYAREEWVVVPFQLKVGSKQVGVN